MDGIEQKQMLPVFNFPDVEGVVGKHQEIGWDFFPVLPPYWLWFGENPLTSLELRSRSVKLRT